MDLVGTHAKEIPLAREKVTGCYASFVLVEKNPYETRNTNLISVDVATKL